MGSNQSSLKLYTFSDISSLISNPLPSNVTLIDVREPSELQSLGKIPQSVNLPYKTHPNALSYSENVWKDTFPGVEKPALENELIFTCAAGVRAKFAADIAAENGYQNLGVYSGSFGDWQANGGKIEQI
ncbi:hypothetical protein QEN19_003084 [Hanseniaspora menglaensis]